MDDALLPIFPLEIVLLPEQPLPLHIFEEQYKLMIGECLKAKSTGTGQQEFGIVLVKDQAMEMVGCTARIINVTRKYADGRMDIFTVGYRRFEVLYTSEERSYLRGGVAYFEDELQADLPDEADAQRAIALFRQAIQRLHKSADVPIHLPRPYRHLSFRIAGSLPLDVDFKQSLLPMRSEPERLRRVSELTNRLISQMDQMERARAKAGGNGDVHPQR